MNIHLTNDQCALLMQYVSNKVDEANNMAHQSVGTTRASYLLEARKLEHLFDCLYNQIKKGAANAAVG